MRITVFGGSEPRPGEPAYEEALLLGRLIGQRGHTVLTGGYIGTMEAMSRGAAEVGGHIIGVTCDEIEAWRPVKPNRWITEEWRFQSLRERIFTLIENCDAALTLPGGVGTLTEALMMWNHLLTEAIQPRPLIFIGKGWQTTIQTFIKAMGKYIPESQRRWAVFSPTVEDAFRRLQEMLGNGKV